MGKGSEHMLGDDGLLYLDGHAVAALCDSVDAIDAVVDAFLAVAQGEAHIPPEAALRWTAPDGSAARSLMLPAAYRGVYGCKVIGSSLGNTARGIPRAHGLIVLFDPDTGAPTSILEGARISALRTAAVSVAAVRAALEGRGCRHLALLGCGTQARTHLELLSSAVPLQEVSLYDVDPERAAAFAERAARELPSLTIEVAGGPKQAVRAADVTVAATTTSDAYVELDWVRDEAVFVNVSLDDATEDLLLGCDHLFVDDWALVSEDETRLLGRLAKQGRVIGPHDAPSAGARRVDAELSVLVGGGYDRPMASSRVVINPFGMGVHDLAVAAQVVKLADARGVGQRLPR